MPKPLVLLGLALAALLGTLLVADGLGLFRKDAASRADFSGTTLDGRPWSLAGQRQRGPLVLSFYATWCSPCQIEIAHLVALKKSPLGAKFEAVVVARESAEELKQIPNLASGMLTVIPAADSVFESWKINALPYSFYFDGRGELVDELEGYADEEVSRRIRRVSGDP